MSRLTESLDHVRLLDDLAKKKTVIHRLHPLVKLMTTAAFLVFVISFDRYAVTGLLPFVLFPVILLSFAELPAAPIFKRLLAIGPFIIGIGILNPLLDRHSVYLGSWNISGGWLTFLSILIKSALTVTAGILLIATTGIDKLAAALRLLRIPRILVLQLLLTYRYLSVLIEETARMMRAYSLRAPGQKGLKISTWGSFAGQLVLRTFERAQRIYRSMILRGFDGEYYSGVQPRPGPADLAYLFGWCAFFLLARLYNLPLLIGLLITGAVSR